MLFLGNCKTSKMPEIGGVMHCSKRSFSPVGARKIVVLSYFCIRPNLSGVLTGLARSTSSRSWGFAPPPTGGAAPRPLPGNLSPGPRAHIRSLNRRFALSIFLRRFHYNIQRHFQIQLSRKHRKRQYSRYAHRARTRFRYRRVYLLCL